MAERAEGVRIVADVICGIGELSQERPTRLARSLSAVSNVSPFVEAKSWPHEFILVAKHGRQISDSLREWNFPSTVPSIDCRYMERWLPMDASYNELKLRHAYLYLYRHYEADRPPKEVLAFHWEPMPDKQADGEGVYRERPHMHFGLAPPPLHRSHFVVTLTVDSERQASVEYLNELLDAVIKMVEVEVLDRIGDRPTGWL